MPEKQGKRRKEVSEARLVCGWRRRLEGSGEAVIEGKRKNIFKRESFLQTGRVYPEENIPRRKEPNSGI
jgi:hypothetical protein